MIDFTQFRARAQAFSERENKPKRQYKRRVTGDLVGFVRFTSAARHTMSLREARRKAFMIMISNRREDGFVYVVQKGTGAILCNTPSQFIYNFLMGDLYSCEQARINASDDAAIDHLYVKTISEIRRDITDIAVKYDPVFA